MIKLDSVPLIICLVTILATGFRKPQPHWLRLCFYLLIFMFIIDMGASLYSGYFHKSNHFIINLSLPVIFISYFLLFYKTFETPRSKNIVVGSIIIYSMVFLTDLIFINGLYFFNIYSYCVASVLIMLCCLLYFVGLFTTDALLNYFRMPMFWISTGMLFFYAGNLVQYSLMWYIIENKLGDLYNVINTLLNTILFGGFSISFLCNYSWKKAS